MAAPSEEKLICYILSSTAYGRNIIPPHICYSIIVQMIDFLVNCISAPIFASQGLRFGSPFSGSPFWFGWVRFSVWWRYGISRSCDEWNDYMTFHPITKTDQNQNGPLPKRTTLKRKSGQSKLWVQKIMTKSKKMHTSRNVEDKVLNFHRVSLSPDQLAGHYEKYCLFWYCYFKNECDLRSKLRVECRLHSSDLYKRFG
jgi:hypothetical protein